MKTYGSKQTQDQIAAGLGLLGKSGRPDAAHQQGGIHHMTYKLDSTNPNTPQLIAGEVHKQINELKRPMVIAMAQTNNPLGVNLKHALSVLAFDRAQNKITFSDPARPAVQLTATPQQLVSGWKLYPDTHPEIEVFAKSLFTTQTPSSSRSNSPT